MRDFTLKELIDICNKYANKEINIDEFKKILDELFVHSLISLRDKVYSSIYILFDCEYSDDLLERFVSLEMNKFWYIVLRYCNIDAMKEQEYCTEDNYELLYMTIYEPIMSIIRDDYNNTMKIFDSIVNYINSETYNNMFSDLMNTDFAKIAEADKMLFEELKNNETMIQNLADITRATNPNIQKIKKDMDQQIVKEINNK